jgi:hypothetical protein
MMSVLPSDEEVDAMTDDRPVIDDRDPADAMTEMVGRVLELATTWVRWDGAPRRVGEREYTPHKAIRRVADHMVDHLAQLEAHMAGTVSLPDRWHGSSITTPSDLAPFSVEDLDEARSRLSRLAQLWRIRLRSIPEGELDHRQGDAYTPREMAFCAVGSIFYAEAVGVLPDV